MPQLNETTYIKQEGKNKRHLHIWSACSICGKARWVRLAKGLPISMLCTSCWTVGERHPNWKGGRILNSSGYFEVKIWPESSYYSMANRKGYVLEHRLVMARNLGRPLDHPELVHHRNGDILDNRPQNLALLNGRGEHRKIHTIWKRIKFYEGSK